jgi:hypothetical protein
MNVSSKRPTRANAISRAPRKLIGAAIAVALLAASPAYAGLEGPQPPCDGGGATCYHNSLLYTDNSWVFQRVTEFADGSGDAMDVYNYYNTQTKTWLLDDAQSQVWYYYVDGVDEYGYPTTQLQYAYAPASISMENNKTLDLGYAMAAGSGGRISNLADGVAPMDAVNKRQLDWVAANASGNDPLAVKYTDGNRNTVSVGGRVANIADGVVGNDAASVNQVNSVNIVAQDGVNRAIQAQNRATTAQVTADKGVADAATALQVGAEGRTLARGAQGTADTARSEAGTAQFTANKGVSDAKAASDLAEQSGRLAVSAQATADGIARYVVATPGAAGDVAASAGPEGAVVLGYGTVAGSNHVAVGQGAVSMEAAEAGSRGAAVGYNARARGNATAIGGEAAADDFAVAVGRSAEADVRGSAFGASSYAVTDSVALGHGSRALEANTVSVGSAEVQRRIVNVADGVAATDAVTMKQHGELTGEVIQIRDTAMRFNGATFSARRDGYATRISGVADGTEASDAVNRSQLDGVEGQAKAAQRTADQVGTDLAALDARAVQFGADGAIQGKGARLANLADGVNATDAVNKRQLDALAGEVGVIGGDALQFDGTTYNATRSGVATRISGVADGTGAGDAVNRSQLDGVEGQAKTAQRTADQVGVDLAALDARAVQFTGQNGAIAAKGARLVDLADGVDAGDAVNRRQLDGVEGQAKTAQQTADQVGTDLAALDARAVQFGADGTIQGKGARLANLADGVDATDAVNKRQLDALAGEVGGIAGDALRFDGTTYNANRSGAATRISGVADGVDAGDAVNRGQLDTVSGQLQDLDGLAVKYTDASHTAVVFGNPEGQAVRLSNVADGVEGTDAVNKRQLDAVVSDVGQVSDNALLFDGQAYNATRGGQSTRITGVAAAITGGDAVNFDQVSALTAVFGGGVSWSNGVLSNPTYNIGGGNFSNVGDALAAVDGKLANLENRVGGVEASPAMQRPVIYDDSTKDAVTLGGVNGTRISNVQAGVAGTDAANVDQVRQGIAESRTYTDTKAQETLRDSKAYTDSRVNDMWRGVEDIAAQVDRRFHETDKRINRQSAMTAAMVQMATNAAGSRSERGRIGAGLGWSSGERALSIGYSRAIGERGSFSIGGALSGGESSAGVGFGFDL